MKKYLTLLTLALLTLSTAPLTQAAATYANPIKLITGAGGGGNYTNGDFEVSVDTEDPADTDRERYNETDDHVEINIGTLQATGGTSPATRSGIDTGLAQLPGSSRAAVAYGGGINMYEMSVMNHTMVATDRFQVQFQWIPTFGFARGIDQFKVAFYTESGGTWSEIAGSAYTNTADWLSTTVTENLPTGDGTRAVYTDAGTWSGVVNYEWDVPAGVVGEQVTMGWHVVDNGQPPTDIAGSDLGDDRNFGRFDELTVTVVPEPSSVVLSGALLMGFFLWRRHRRYSTGATVPSDA